MKIYKSRLYILLIPILGILHSYNLSAQIDAHYWTHQYGSKGLLLNGAVIANPGDETSIFYNPGSMGLDDNLGFAFSFITPTYSRLNTTNFIGDNSVIRDDGLDLSPGFLAVRVRPFKNKKFVLGVASFERFKSNIEYTERAIEGSTNSNELYRADLEFSKKLSEDWIGIGLAYNLSEYLGIGFTQYSVWHSQNIDSGIKKEILSSNNPIVSNYSWYYDFDYNFNLYAAFVTKLGLAYASNDFNLGLSFTSPLYGITRSSASYGREDQRATLDSDAVMVISNRNEPDVIDYKTAYSIGVGLELIFNNYSISISTEYFAPVNEFTYFREVDDPFDGQSENPSLTLTEVSAKNQQVINGAIGLQFIFNHRVTFVGGIRTDFNQNNALNINRLSQYLSSTPDIYYLSFGALIKSDKNLVSVGVNLGYGASKNGNQIVNFSNINPENIFTLTGNNSVSTNFNQIMLFFTYDFLFSNIESH